MSEEKLFELKPLFVKDLSILFFIVLMLTTIISVIVVNHTFSDLTREKPFLLYMFFVTDFPVALLISFLIHRQSKKLELTKYNIYEDRIEILINDMNNYQKKVLNFNDVKKVFISKSIMKNGVNMGSITILTKSGNYQYLKNIDNYLIIYALIQKKVIL